MSFIEIKNLTIDSSMDGINFTAVNNISLNIEKGTKVAILGESGAGKSLITKLLAGVLDTEKNVVSSGEVLIDGVNILEELKPFPIGYVFRKTAARVYEKNTHVDEQLKNHFIKVLNIDEEKAEFLLSKWEKHFDLEPDTLRHMPRHISQFDIEKSLIIHALADDPKLFIYDLPKDDVTIQQKEALLTYIDEIQKKVAEHFNISVKEMQSSRRARTVARPRQIAMYLAKQLTSRSLPEIGRKFDRDHTTVMHAVRKVEELIIEDISLAESIDTLRRALDA